MTNVNRECLDHHRRQPSLWAELVQKFRRDGMQHLLLSNFSVQHTARNLRVLRKMIYCHLQWRALTMHCSLQGPFQVYSYAVVGWRVCLLVTWLTSRC